MLFGVAGNHSPEKRLVEEGDDPRDEELEPEGAHHSEQQARGASTFLLAELLVPLPEEKKGAHQLFKLQTRFNYQLCSN